MAERFHGKQNANELAISFYDSRKQEESRSVINEKARGIQRTAACQDCVNELIIAIVDLIGFLETFDALDSTIIEGHHPWVHA